MPTGKTRTTRKASKDVIQRSYLLRKLNRMKRDIDICQPPLDGQEVVAMLITWTKAQRQRSKRPGGL